MKSDKKLRFSLRFETSCAKNMHEIDKIDAIFTTDTPFSLNPIHMAIHTAKIILVSTQNTIMASMIMHFVNGALLREKELVPDNVVKDLLPSEAFFLQKRMDYIANGISFLQFSKLRVLPEFQKHGLAKWTLQNAPNVAQELFGWSFDAILAPIVPALFASEDTTLQKMGAMRELGKKALLLEREVRMKELLSSLGYSEHEVAVGGKSRLLMAKAIHKKADVVQERASGGAR